MNTLCVSVDVTAVAQVLTPNGKEAVAVATKLTLENVNSALSVAGLPPAEAVEVYVRRIEKGWDKV